MTDPTLQQDPTPRMSLRGVDFDRVREDTVVHHVVDSALGGEGGWVCPVNLDVLRQHAVSGEVRELMSHADVVVADGMPLIWASRVQGEALPERVAGSSLLHTLPPYAAERGARLFFLGGNEGAASAAAAALTDANPHLDVAGTHCPPFGFEKDPARLAEIHAALATADPHIVFVGLGFPKQERLIAALRESHPHRWFVSCGIAFSMASGEVRRAPRWVRNAGLEWLHRLTQEPKRLARRYLVDGPPFMLRLFANAAGTRRARRLRA